MGSDTGTDTANINWTSFSLALGCHFGEFWERPLNKVSKDARKRRGGMLCLLEEGAQAGRHWQEVHRMSFVQHHSNPLVNISSQDKHFMPFSNTCNGGII